MILPGILSSQISGHLYSYSTDFYQIATATVTSGGAATVTFSSIPSTYKHLQIRISAESNRATYGTDSVQFKINNDVGTNYSFHQLGTDGSTAYGLGVINTATMYWDVIGTTQSAFGGGVVDILDYANTNKYKTFRSLMGNDNNGTIAGSGGAVALASGNWRNTAAIDTITLNPVYGTLFNQNSTFALYGVK